MDMKKPLKDFIKSNTVPLNYFDQSRLNVSMDAVLFDYLASEGYSEEQIQSVFDNNELCEEIIYLYVKMKTEQARTSYVMDLAFKSNSGVDYTTSMQNAQNDYMMYYNNIKSKLDSRTR